MSNEPWHLSKTVPASLIFAIAMQTVALVWFVSSLNSSVETNRTSIIKLETKTETMEQIVQQQAISTARMDENIKAIRSAVEAMAGR
jgi:type VI protein secretion system component VasK